MPLEKKYPAAFEKLWNAYPRWPSGRSVKKLAAEKFVKANRDLEFTDADIDAILADIELRKRTCETWQEGNKYGPKAMQSYIHQQLWNEPYATVKQKREAQQSRSTYDDRPMWQQLGYTSQIEYDRACEAKAPRISEELAKLKGELRKVH